ncbi:MAG TPA: aminopeptidase [Gemmatimonadaceae bacterium]|nr:aminopeptidase [Gemmatimonadaceae bacterium]
MSSPFHTLLRVVRWVLGTVVVLVALFLIVTPIGRYLAQAAWAEGKILAARRPIVGMVTDSTVNPAVRDKLQLVLAARAFAVDSVGLRARTSFTTYSRVTHDTLVLVLAGAYRDRLVPYTWWFPIVGRVPYKGYFDFAAAHEAAQALERRGYDAYLRPSPAFSTLGWFNDPLLSTTLGGDSVSLANTVIHELTHNTFYASGQAVFNESFANFVGARGAEWFFAARGDSGNAAFSAAEWSDQRTMGRFWDALYGALDSAFHAHPSSRPARLAARDTIYARAQMLFADSVLPSLKTVHPRAGSQLRLNNAVLLARRIYRTRLDLFDAVYADEGFDLRRTVREVIALAKSRPDDPYGALARWVKSERGERRRAGRQ